VAGNPFGPPPDDLGPADLALLRRGSRDSQASSVVGICTTRTPRRKMLAAKPARSPTTPPPSATTTSFRSIFAASRPSQTSANDR
jgi:hypothetical protein